MSPPGGPATDKREGDRIELRGLLALAVCGALPEEQERPQPLEVDLDVHLDLTAAGASDELGDTVDYGGLCAQVEEVLAQERFTLLERVATRVAETVLDHHLPVTAVTVTVRKLRPPVASLLATSGVTITRAR
jgi:dihydroneopterin aldolase